MRYRVHYVCLSHIGKVRSANQDNFICHGRFQDVETECLTFPLSGHVTSEEMAVFGVFDGMGGEERGETAAWIAANQAAGIHIGKDPAADLARFCREANSAICAYADAHQVSSMGTTAALLAFTPGEVTLCNIGDSKIFRFCDGILEQISTDHVAIAAFGTKPPLSQNLGIPPSELIIDPYLAHGPCNYGDIYLICSDGLTDMLSIGEITEILSSDSIVQAASQLMEQALDHGGKDNTTIILCEIQRRSGWFDKWIRPITGKEV